MSVLTSWHQSTKKQETAVPPSKSYPEHQQKQYWPFLTKLCLMPVKRVARVLLATKLALSWQLRDSFLYSYEINIGGEGNTSLCCHVFGNLSQMVCNICPLNSGAYAEYIRTPATIIINMNNDGYPKIKVMSKSDDHNMMEKCTCDSNYGESCHV